MKNVMRLKQYIQLSLLQKISKKIINILVFAIVPLFFLKTIYNFLNEGSDFNIVYKLSNLFLKRNDVFKNVIDNPLYPHSLYVLFSPFNLFDLETSKVLFFIFNIILLIISIFSLVKIFNLNNSQAKILFIAGFTATPFTNLLAIQNLSLIVFASLIFFYKSQSKFNKSFFLFISFFKYNISFIFIFYTLIKKEYKIFTYFIILNLFFILIYYLYIDIRLIKNMFDPFFLAYELIQGKNISQGYTNNISKTFFSIQSVMIFFELNRLYPIFFFLFLGFIFYLFKKVKLDNHTEFVSLFLISSLLVYHGMYDFVILLPLLAYAMKYFQLISLVYIHLFSILFIFYIFKINKLFFNNFLSDQTMSIIGCGSLILSLVILVTINSKEILSLKSRKS